MRKNHPFVKSVTFTPDAKVDEVKVARKIINDAEVALRRILSQGERRDLLKDNTTWASDRCDDIVRLIAIRN